MTHPPSAVPDPFSPFDHECMQRALAEARRALGRTSPNPAVGAVIAREGRVLGAGFHRQAGQPHAEIEAIAAAGGEAACAGADIYVTLEPCCHQGRTPPCTDALIRAQFKRVVAAHPDPHPRVAGQGFAALRAAGIQVQVGLEAHEAARLNEAFIQFHQLHRPLMISKWGMTLDGRIATDSGSSRWITNEASRHHVHELRAQVDGVLVGIGTVLQDNPVLNVRLGEGYDGPQPWRIIVDGHLRIPLRAKCLVAGDPARCLIATTDLSPVDKVRALREAGHQVLVFNGRRGLINLRDFVGVLPHFHILSVLVEGGSTMHGTLLKLGLIDKVFAYVAPKICGGSEERSPVHGWGVRHMSEALQLRDCRTHVFGTDVCIEGYVPDEYRHLEPFGLRRAENLAHAVTALPDPGTPPLRLHQPATG